MNTFSKTRNILVADDDPVSRKLVTAVLEKNGYRVQAASDGAEALAFAREKLPDLIIADVLMPVMDGYELAHRLRQDESLGGLPIILYTGTYSEREALSLAEECGVWQVLGKPIEPARLLSCVARAMDSKPAPVPTFDFPEKHRQVLVSKLLEQSGELKQVKRLQAEEAIGRLVSILEATPDFVGIINAADGKPVYVNPAGRRMLGISPGEEIEGLNPSEFRPQWATDVTEIEGIPAAIQNGSWTGQTAFTSRDGREIPVSMVIIAHKSATGEPEYLSTIARDVTRERRLEELLRRSQKMEAIGRLAGGIAHDFNNMLTVILGHTVLLKNERLPPDMESSVTAIRNAADRASALTNQLLAFSRKQIAQLQVLNVNDIIAGMKGVIESALGEGIDFQTKLESDAGQVRADAAQLERAIMSLVANSHDAMPHGGAVVVETSNANIEDDSCKGRLSVPPGGYVSVSVRDTGCGMDAETISHVFEPFFSTKPVGQGAGLGLATTFAIVQQAGGYVTVYSEPGTGTTFRIYLPRIDQPDQGLPSRTISGGTETILLTEDDDEVRRSIRQALEKRGYTILETASYSEALQVGRTYTNTIHLLITDLVLPQSNGAELASILLRARKMKVLYISGYTRQFAMGRGLLPPDGIYIEKPFSFNALSLKVRETLDEVQRAFRS